MISFSSGELHKITGIKPKNIYVYWTREELYRDENKKYPYDHPLNKAFIETRGTKAALKLVLENKNKPKEVKKKPVKRVVKKTVNKK